MRNRWQKFCMNAFRFAQLVNFKNVSRGEGRARVCNRWIFDIPIGWGTVVNRKTQRQYWSGKSSFTCAIFYSAHVWIRKETYRLSNFNDAQERRNLTGIALSIMASSILFIQQVKEHWWFCWFGNKRFKSISSTRMQINSITNISPSSISNFLIRTNIDSFCNHVLHFDFFFCSQFEY